MTYDEQRAAFEALLTQRAQFEALLYEYADLTATSRQRIIAVFDAATQSADQVRRDAERYRYLRNDTKRDADPDNAMYVLAPGGEDVLTGWVLDSQIDLALAASPAPHTADETRVDGEAT